MRAQIYRKVYFVAITKSCEWDCKVPQSALLPQVNKAHLVTQFRSSNYPTYMCKGDDNRCLVCSTPEVGQDDWLKASKTVRYRRLRQMWDTALLTKSYRLQLFIVDDTWQVFQKNCCIFSCSMPRYSTRIRQGIEEFEQMQGCRKFDYECIWISCR